MDKAFAHKDHEDKITDAWEKSGAFVAPTYAEATAGKPDRKPFCIIMPPPNANDPLHVGHAMFITVEDILIRYHRMRGEATLWLPGTDHAGIETQFVFEKKLAKEGKSRYDFDRETLYQMIADYVSRNSGVAVDQMKRLGASADWSRFKFTLDKDIVSEVTDAFVKLHEDGLIYRGQKLVNYCVKCGTSYSELEVEYEEKEDKLYEIDYGSGVVVATTRPETLLGDVAVAVNPKDPRYIKMIGKKLILPIVGKEIPIVADEMVDVAFGTGAVKITPAHNPNDWAVAERQGWDTNKIVAEHQIIGTNGKMNENAGGYAGLTVTAAREKIITDLGEKIVSIKTIKHNVGCCYRCHRTIEPLPSDQFFVKTQPLAQKTLAAMDSEETIVLGAGRDKILRHWLENLRDWNISRQIVWGIRIPVWYPSTSSGQSDKNKYIVSKTSPGEGWVQETDTFDTWFSSGQWPVVTLKTGRDGDFDYYYPTTVMETGYDILPIWVMRMMLLGIYLTGKSPFKWVYLHGLVRDEQGRKMSKSVGNVINPLDLVEKYGADALRMALVMSTTPGNDSSVGESKVRGMRNLANKIWNAGRYLQENSKTQEFKDSKLDDEFKKKLVGVVREVTQQLEDLKIGLAAETVYNEFWHWFCDVAIEESKNGQINREVLGDGLKVFLKLLHPFVPFVTEAVWQEVFPDEGLLAASSWPYDG